MENYNIPADVKVFGVQVKTFPDGIGDVFNKLIKLFPPEDKRPYYGISTCTDAGITYIAAALETFDGEAEQYGYESFTVEKGDYLVKTVMNWTKKTHCIKNFFEEILTNEYCDRTKPAIEIYKNDIEMMCLVKADERKKLQSEFETATKELIQVLSSFSQKQINETPYEGSWTAGQVAQHLVLSGSDFAQLLSGPVKETQRAPDEWTATIRESFLNFDIKMESPDFVRPAITDYEKESVINALKNSSDSIIKALQTADLSKTCTAFEMPVIGFITKSEAINFVTVHTKRHVHQLNKIYKIIGKKEDEKNILSAKNDLQHV